jgi:hypothetical protein
MTRYLVARATTRALVPVVVLAALGVVTFFTDYLQGRWQTRSEPANIYNQGQRFRRWPSSRELPR